MELPRHHIATVMVLFFVSACATGELARPTPEEADPEPKRIRYSGGDGRSCTNAVVIRGAKTKDAGVLAEINWIAERHPGSTILEESATSCSGRSVDRITVEVPGGEKVDFYFDASQFESL